MVPATDAALADLDKGVAFDRTRLREIRNGKDEKLAGVAADPVDIGEILFKIGRTTGPTAGRVTAFDMDNVVVEFDDDRELRLDGQIEIEGAGVHAFSDGGDSGSLIVNDGMRAVGLLFAGSEQGGSNRRGLTYACPIGRVLNDLKAKLLT